MAGLDGVAGRHQDARDLARHRRDGDARAAGRRRRGSTPRRGRRRGRDRRARPGGLSPARTTMARLVRPSIATSSSAASAPSAVRTRCDARRPDVQTRAVDRRPAARRRRRPARRRASALRAAAASPCSDAQPPAPERVPRRRRCRGAGGARGARTQRETGERRDRGRGVDLGRAGRAIAAQCSSMNPVCVAPAANAGCARTSCRKARFVVGPRMTVSRSATRSRRTATSRSGPQRGELREQRVVLDRAPRCRSRCRSRRARPGPWARAAAGSRPALGRKPAAGSSAHTRTSMAWPRLVTSAWANPSGSPRATRSCAATRSMPVTHSVTGCSTWRRVFISRK